MTIAQLQVTWKGLPGGDGFSFFYVRSTAASISPLPTFFDALKAFFPSRLSWVINPFWKLIDETNGKMTGAGGGGPQPTITATGPDAFPPNAGAQVRWETPDFVNGRRVKGRTYLVPMCGSFFGSNGLFTANTAGQINAAADVMRSAYTGNLVVWSRPLFEKDANGNPTDVLKRAGSVHTVTTTVCPTKVVTLNGRRDT